MLNIFKKLFNVPENNSNYIKYEDLVEGELYSINDYIIFKFDKVFRKILFLEKNRSDIFQFCGYNKEYYLEDKKISKASENDNLIYNTYIESQKLRNLIEVFQTSKEFIYSDIAQLVINKKASQYDSALSDRFSSHSIYLDLEDLQYFQNKYGPIAKKEHEKILQKKIEQTEKNLNGLKKDYADIIHNKTD